MKKVLFFVAILSTLLLLSACDKKEDDTIEINLKGNPTTGYSWEYTISDESILKLKSNEYEAENTNDGIVGTGGTYEFEFNPIKEGTSTITFNYLRTWETEAPLYTLTYEFKIDKDLQVTLISKSGTDTEGNIPNPEID